MQDGPPICTERSRSAVSSCYERAHMVNESQTQNSAYILKALLKYIIQRFNDLNRIPKQKNRRKAVKFGMSLG